MEALIERFWSKVDRRGPDECWNWRAGTRRSYGLFGTFKNRRNAQAHRFAWEITNGPIPKGICVLHRCDNPPCVNPSHLYLGSQIQNMVECDQKGRRQTGDQHWTRRSPELLKARMTAEKASEIRAALKAGSKPSELAKVYGVSRQMVYNISWGRTWTTA